MRVVCVCQQRVQSNSAICGSKDIFVLCGAFWGTRRWVVLLTQSHYKALSQ